MTQRRITESFLLVLSEVISFSGYSKGRFQMSFLRFHRNSDFKLLHPKNDLTLWDEYKHHKIVVQKSSLQFSMEDISLLDTGLWLPLNYPFTEASKRFRISLCKLNIISVRILLNEKRSLTVCTESTRHRAVSQEAPSGLYLRLFLFQDIPKSVTKCHFSDSTETVISNCSIQRIILL